MPHIGLPQTEPVTSARKVKHAPIGAEALAFEVALASMLAKYLRELFVEALNRWFVARVPHLTRTAGYYTDGLRFLGDLEREGALSSDERIRLVRVR